MGAVRGDRAYYRSNEERLMRVRAKYDPDNLFRSQPGPR
jgi:FAD/FMN-containing dehydrogenase